MKEAPSPVELNASLFRSAEASRDFRQADHTTTETEPGSMDYSIGPQIVERARSYVGVPYRHYGRTRTGVDCCGLVLAVAAELGVSSYKPEPYSKLVDPAVMRRQLEKQMLLIPEDEKQPGDSVLLKVRGIPQHMGIWTGPTLIHAFDIRGAVVEVTWSGYWEQRLEAVFRWRDAHG